MLAQPPSPSSSSDPGEALLAQLGESDAVRSILDVVCQTTGMGFAAVAHVTKDRWVACQVRDDIAFGLTAGGELPVRSTLCDTVRGTGQSIVIDEVATDPVYRHHHTPATYGLQSYIAVPILLEDKEIFGTLCAIDPRPHQLDTVEIRTMFSLFARLIGTQVDRLRTSAENRTLEQRVAEVLAEKKVYADIIDSSTAAVTALDLDGRVLAINHANVEAFHRVYGKRPAAGDDFLSLFDDAPDYKDQQRQIWSRALSGETFVTVQEFGDVRIERRCYEVRFTPLLNSAGQRIGASSTSHDVTDRVLAERQLAAAQEQLLHAQKLEAMGQLTGGVAHDFNNLLTPIIGSLDMLNRREVIGERERRLLAGAIQSADRAKTLVQRLLAFARRQPLQSRSLDLAKLISGLSELIRSTTGPAIRVIVEAPDDLPAAEADATQLEMALLNLSVNARDAMPNGGELHITASAEALGAGHSTGLAAGPYIRLTVADTGVGMDEPTLARAIEPFFSTKGIGKGTGLGLSMVDGLARQLGGAVSLQSTPGQGTAVALWLPISASAPEVADESSTAPPKFSAGLVLLVEDEDLVRATTADMLTEIGYEVVEVASAADALERISAGLCPDVVVTDHLMPGMSGTDLAHALAESCPNIPALIISGYAEAEGVSARFARLAKPFRSEELSESLALLRA